MAPVSRVSVSRTFISTFGFLIAWAYLSLLLNMPNWTGDLFGPNHMSPSLEVAAIFGLLALASAAGGRAGRSFCVGLALAALVLAALRLADISSHMLIGRPVDLSLDLMLLPAILEVLAGSASVPELAVAAVAVPAVLAGLYFLNLLAIRTAASFLERRPNRRLFAGTLAALAVPTLFGMAPYAPLDQGATALLRWQVAQAVQASALRAEHLDRFRSDPFAGLSEDAVLAHLGRRDVYVMFFESYGETVLADPRYRSVIEPTLADFDRALAGQGFGVRSGLIESPIRGGQSWLAHGTFLSGARLGDQGLYNLMLESGRQSLAHYFRRAGYETMAVMPALSRAWPEGAFWGFDRIWSTDDMGYAGPPFGWAAIPDQYTLDFIHRQKLRQRDRPLFIEYALISSHGPWEPLPPLLEDWDAIGDGSAFDGMAPPLPAEQPAWSGMTRNYADSVDYTLKVLRDYITRYISDDALIIVLGDHQPAPLITGDGASRSVPVHVISRDPELLAPFEEWGFNPGMIPASERQPLPMERFRDRFLAAFSARETG
ncbi:sulfatase-like hydrolase/transferase [Skermanella mucosa]|uniref:sulfatase-like hydrolase/transferase n=1 Tax=Skermanella mucosa TaxID=1789672 RepID=UPI00192C3772|nr:sulfatase-like hydrolase/transferase [Skermanella mucosa]UEM19727.1 sulfatase-like hydrolase/transferase [Skermanella mucosa]